MKKLNGQSLEDIVNEITKVVDVEKTEKWNDDEDNGIIISMKSGWLINIYYHSLYNIDSEKTGESINIEANSNGLKKNGKLPIEVVSEIKKINKIFDNVLVYSYQLS